MRRSARCCLLLAAGSLAAALAAADPALEARAAALSARLRCMVCQNQTLAESDAPLAEDMRRQVREQLAAGRSEDQVTAFFEERYGAFVRYDPPFARLTWLLWLGPFLLLGLGCIVLWRVLAGRRAAPAAPLTEAERRRASGLLGEEENA